MSLTEQMRHLAEQEFHYFGEGQHKEWEDGFYQHIGGYWMSVGFHRDGRTKDDTGQRIPWSAAFIGWIVKRASIESRIPVDFPNCESHSEYVRWATRARRENDADAPFYSYNITETRPQVGDILVNNREGGAVTLENQPDGYVAHGAVVVQVDAENRTIRTIGGNESDSVGEHFRELDDDGHIVQLNRKGGAVAAGDEGVYFIGIVRYRGTEVAGEASVAAPVEANVEGFDTSKRLTVADIQCLAGDFRFMLKYLFPGTANPGKDWTAAELSAAAAAGLKRGTIMQSRGSQASDFSTAQGTAAASKAITKAQALGIQNGSTIYFSVDFDASPSEIASAILPHFTAIHAEMARQGDPYRVGVYGSSLVAIKLQAANLVQNTWINGSTGHGFGTRAQYLASNKWTLLQHDLDSTAHCNVETDSNTCRDFAGAGFF